MTAAVTSATHTSSRTYTSLAAAWIPLAALCLAFFVEMVDNTLLSIALPTIGRDMAGDTTAVMRPRSSPGRLALSSTAACTAPWPSATPS